jgi:hypothetical protein
MADFLIPNDILRSAYNVFLSADREYDPAAAFAHSIFLANVKEQSTTIAEARTFLADEKRVLQYVERIRVETDNKTKAKYQSDLERDIAKEEEGYKQEVRSFISRADMNQQENRETASVIKDATKDIKAATEELKLAMTNIAPDAAKAAKAARFSSNARTALYLLPFAVAGGRARKQSYSPSRQAIRTAQVSGQCSAGRFKYSGRWHAFGRKYADNFGSRMSRHSVHNRTASRLPKACSCYY